MEDWLINVKYALWLNIVKTQKPNQTIVDIEMLFICKEPFYFHPAIIIPGNIRS